MHITTALEQVLAQYNAIPIDRYSMPELYRIVERLTRSTELPMPQLYIIPEAQPNAFATGRNYENAVVAVTEGLLNLLNEDEVEAVIAHELSHIKHYDMLIGTKFVLQYLGDSDVSKLWNVFWWR